MTQRKIYSKTLLIEWNTIWRARDAKSRLQQKRGGAPETWSVSNIFLFHLYFDYWRVIFPCTMDMWSNFVNMRIFWIYTITNNWHSMATRSKTIWYGRSTQFVTVCRSWGKAFLQSLDSHKNPELTNLQLKIASASSPQWLLSRQRKSKAALHAPY